MSRAINLSVSHTDVTAFCERNNIVISAIERLPGGGTRVVLMNTDDTAIVAGAFKTNIIEGTVRRTSPFARTR